MFSVCAMSDRTLGEMDDSIRPRGSGRNSVLNNPATDGCPIYCTTTPPTMMSTDPNRVKWYSHQLASHTVPYTMIMIETISRPELQTMPR